jgi:hypothetical protein
MCDRLSSESGSAAASASSMKSAFMAIAAAATPPPMASLQGKAYNPDTAREVLLLVPLMMNMPDA